MEVKNGKLFLSNHEIDLYVDWCGFRPVPENSVDFIKVDDECYTDKTFINWVRKYAWCGCSTCALWLEYNLTLCTNRNLKAKKFGVRAMTEYYQPKIHKWIETIREMRKDHITAGHRN